MSLIRCQGLSFAHGSESIFDDVTFSIEPGEHVALVGANGSGKSTLLRLLAGEIAPDGGKLIVKSGITIQVVPQFVPDALKACTVHAAVASNARAGTMDHEIGRVLDELGFTRPDWEKKVGELSGGWANRLLLARALVQKPDLVLLDEPTNHMDLATLLFFERFVAEKLRCAMLLVSHDRTLLDACAHRTLFLRDKKIYAFRGSYSPARELLLAHDEAAARARHSEEREIERLRASAKRLAMWGKVWDNEKLSARARNIEKRALRLEATKTCTTSDEKRTIAIDTYETRAQLALRCEDVGIDRPDGSPLFRIDRLYVKKGDRIAILGKNGCGKTLFLQELVASFRRGDGGPIAKLRFNPQVELGYYDQYLRQIDPTWSLARVVRNKAALIRAGFPATEHERTTRDLSGGERARLQFLLLRLQRPSLLVLDEPTNHIDIPGCENLESELLESEATVLLVSHDRRFVANVATRFVLIEDGRLTEVASPDAYWASEDERKSQPKTVSAKIDGDDLLGRISTLEGKLVSDRRQKPARQNAARQRTWENELANLYARLEEVAR